MFGKTSVAQTPCAWKGELSCAFYQRATFSLTSTTLDPVTGAGEPPVGLAVGGLERSPIAHGNSRKRFPWNFPLSSHNSYLTIGLIPVFIPCTMTVVRPMALSPRISTLAATDAYAATFLALTVRSISLRFACRATRSS